jgi:acetyl-CoA acetyltransferase
VDAGITDERAMAEVAVRSRRDAKNNPDAQVSGDGDVDALLAGEYVRAPLRRHDLPPITDGAAAMVLATRERALQLRERPAFITGFDHRTECHNPVYRDLTDSPSARIAAEAAGFGNGPVELAELQAAFTHEEILLRRAIGLGDDVPVNTSGGALASNPIMATGLARMGYAANHVFGGGKRALAHSTSGPCLQQNLICILEGDA